MPRTEPVADPSPAPTAPLPAKRSSSARTFAEIVGQLRASAAEPTQNALVRAIHSLERGQRFVDRVIRQALAGRDFSQQELLAIQAGVYRYTQELELLSRIVEKSISAVRQTLQAQA